MYLVDMMTVVVLTVILTHCRPHPTDVLTPLLSCSHCRPHTSACHICPLILPYCRLTMVAPSAQRRSLPNSSIEDV